MEDQSYLDKMYFVSKDTYNCPYCNRRQVTFDIQSVFAFHWTADKLCYGYIIKCNSCQRQSLHLSWEHIANTGIRFNIALPIKKEGKEYQLDDLFFYHQPTSFFTIDDRINKEIRELITEAEGCYKMNYLIGASACLRKAIYETLRKEEIGPEVGHYSDRIKALKSKFPGVEPIYFDVLDNIKDMTSDNLHEQSWESFDSATLKELLGAMKLILNEMYVLPREKVKNLTEVSKLLEELKKNKKESPKSKDNE